MLTVMRKNTVHVIKANVQCRPSVLTQARNRPRHWSSASSMGCCCRPDHAAIRRHFRSATSSMGRACDRQERRSCITPQTIGLLTWDSGVRCREVQKSVVKNCCYCLQGTVQYEHIKQVSNSLWHVSAKNWQNWMTSD